MRLCGIQCAFKNECELVTGGLSLYIMADWCPVVVSFERNATRLNYSQHCSRTSTEVRHVLIFTVSVCGLRLSRTESDSDSESGVWGRLLRGG